MEEARARKEKANAADYTSLNRIIITHKPFKRENIPERQPQPENKKANENGIL
jgi:hypothetical protein